MKKIIVFTVAGGRYLDLYNRYTLPSLAADIAHLQAQEYEIETVLHDSHQERVLNPSDVILPALREMVARCAHERAAMWLAPPDTVFSLGSMVNCVLATEHKPYSVAIPHVRVTAGPPTLPMSAPWLMRWAMQNPHDSFSKTFDHEPFNCTWAGIAVRQLSDTSFVMQHNLPTLYLVRFEHSDIEFWNTCPEWQQWDRSFLMKLWHEGRVVVAGSTDMAACVEITEPCANVPEVRPAQYSDRYFAESTHNRALKSLLYYMQL